METDKGKELRAGLVSALEKLHMRGDVVEGIFTSLSNSQTANTMLFLDDLLKLKICSAGLETFEAQNKPSGTEFMAREFLCLLLISQARKMITMKEGSEWDSMFLLENLEANSISSPEMIAATLLISKVSSLFIFSTAVEFQFDFFLTEFGESCIEGKLHFEDPPMAVCQLSSLHFSFAVA